MNQAQADRLRKLAMADAVRGIKPERVTIATQTGNRRIHWWRS